MVKQDKNKKAKAVSNTKKHKPIEAPVGKTHKESKQTKPPGKMLFQIVN